MTDAELLKYSCEHLHYEVWMLEQVASRLVQLSTSLAFDRVSKNMAVESFTIHARTLTAFIYPDESQDRPTDVSADAYVCDSVEWRAARGDLPTTLLTVMQRTGKEITHLTTRRLNYDAPNREWPVVSIVERLWASLKLFASHASSQRLDPAVCKYIAALECPTTAKRITVHATTCTGFTTVSGPAELLTVTDVRTRLQ